VEGLARTLGRQERRLRGLRVGGVEYTLARPRLRDWLALELALAQMSPDPIEAATRNAAGVPETHRDAYWREAYRSAAESRKVDLDSIDKLPFMLSVASQAFVCLRRHHEAQAETLNASLDWLDRAAEDHGMEALSALLKSLLAAPTIDEGSGKNLDAGPSTGPA